MKQKLYRGTTRKEAKGKQELESWSTSLEVAVVYSAPPRDPKLTPTSTIHFAELPADHSVLYLCEMEHVCDFVDILEALQFEEPNGMTVSEALELLKYLHLRVLGKAKPSGEFAFQVIDDEGNVQQDWGTFRGETIISLLFVPEFEEDGPGTRWTLKADAYAFADAPVFGKVARRLGYDAVMYKDVFQGGSLHVENLLGCEVEDLEPWVEEQTDELGGGDWWDTVWTNETVRPLHRDALVLLGDQPAEEVLKGLDCRQREENPLKKRLMR